jgi:pantoate--beta-alanine ligase
MLIEKTRMEVASTAVALRARVAEWRRAGARVGLVPTMGNLHEGHYSLLELARRKADCVVASVFVNPTQFGPREDFSSYPRTLEADREGLEARGCDLLFAPAVDEVYPFGVDKTVRVDVPVVTETLEGALRPGHFNGVATVVTKLFNFVQPDLAVFGQKDYQQLLVIRRMVADLALPIEIVAAPTLREGNGLAMSSRNQYLSPQERERAGVIHRTLQRMAEAVRANAGTMTIETEARKALEGEGLSVDYAALRRAEDLGEPGPGQRSGLIGLIAARLGRARLIDNLLIDL